LDVIEFKMAPESPSAEFYVTPGSPVSCLTFLQQYKQDLLLVGLTSGELVVYDCCTWKQVHKSKVFSNGFLWMEALSESTLVCQGRFESLKLLEISPTNLEKSECEKQTEEVQDDSPKVRENQNGEEVDLTNPVNQDQNGEDFKHRGLRETASFLVIHKGFCKGLTIASNEEDRLIIAPSSACTLLVLKSREKYIRSMTSLNPEQVYTDVKFGSLMCCAQTRDEGLLGGYENSDVILWNRRTGSAMARVELAQCGTLMTLASDPLNGYFVAAGSENMLVVVEILAPKDPTKDDLTMMQVRKERELTNAGVSVAGIRPDRRLLATGGWDHRIRIFSWKHPEKVKPLAVLPFHTQAIECLAFTKQPISAGRTRSNLLAAGSKDGKISLWSIYNL